jgi:hypothetical protein
MIQWGQMIANDRGIGMIGVIAGVGLAAAMGAAALNMILQSSKSGKDSEYRFDVQMLVSEIGMTLKNSQACYNTFNGLDAASATGILSVKNAANQEVFSLNHVHGHTGAKVESFSLEDRAGPQDGVAVVPGNKGSTHFLLKFKPKMKSIFENRDLYGKVRLAIRTDGAGRILSCYATGSGQDQIWSQAATDPSKIYYDAGKVGVGLSTPSETLDINGWISGQSALGQISLGGSNTEYHLQAGTGPVTLESLSGGKGNLKINEARPQHLLHLTSAVIACNAAREGALRYEASIKRVQVCSSGSWQTLTVVRWCLPPWQYHPANDANDVVMHMRETDTARQPQGSPCLKSQIDPTRPKRDADIDHRPSADNNTPDNGSFGWYFQSNDSGKRRKCINNYNCRDYRDIEQ